MGQKLFVSNLQLSPKQANLVVTKHYPQHLDFNCPIEQRTKNNPEFVKNKTHWQNCERLIDMLTAPVGTEFVVEDSYKTKGVGSIAIYPLKDKGKGIIAFRDESMEHANIAKVFLMAKSFHWFKSKLPL